MNDGQTLKTSKRYPDVPDHLIRRIQVDAIQTFIDSDFFHDTVKPYTGSTYLGNINEEFDAWVAELELLEDGNFGEQD